MVLACFSPLKGEKKGMNIKPVVKKPVIRAVYVPQVMLEQNGKPVYQLTQTGWEDFDIKWNKGRAYKKMVNRPLKIAGGGGSNRSANKYKVTSIRQGDCETGEFMHFVPKLGKNEGGYWQPGIPDTKKNRERIAAWGKPEHVIYRVGKKASYGPLIQRLDRVDEVVVEEETLPDDVEYVENPQVEKVRNLPKLEERDYVEPEKQEKTKTEAVPEEVKKEPEQDEREALLKQAEELGVRTHHSQKNETIKKNIEEALKDKQD